MSRRSKIAAITIFFVLAAFLVIKVRARYRKLTPELEISFWCWQTPFRLTTTETAQLKKLGVKQLFVRAGTFHRCAGGIHCLLPQRWERVVGAPPAHLVFRFSGDIAAGFAKISVTAMSRALLQTAAAQRRAAESAGIQVIGLQIDFDCPTHRLSAYAGLLRAIRAALASSKLALSITALPTWYSDEAMNALLASVDFSVPQYYEAAIPQTSAAFVTVSEPGALVRGLTDAARCGAPFYAGLPAYGHGILFDAEGRYAGLYPALTPRDAFRHPSFRLERAFASDAQGKPTTAASYIGEDILDFVAEKPGRDGRGKGYHLIFDLPTEALVAKQIATVRANRPPNCRGVVLFRFPDAAATMSVPLPAIASAVRGDEGNPRLAVVCHATQLSPDTGDVRGSGEAEATELTVSVTNVGNASAAIRPNAVAVTLVLDRAGLEEASPGGFDAVSSAYVGDSFESASFTSLKDLSPLEASLPRSNTLRFVRTALAAGETTTIGPVVIPAGRARRVRGFWSAVVSGGFATREGELSTFEIAKVQGTRR